MEISLSDEQLKALAELIAARILDKGAASANCGGFGGKAMAKPAQMDIKEVAIAFGVQAQTIRKWMRSELKFPAPVSVGAKLIWERVDIERHKAEQQ